MDKTIIKKKGMREYLQEQSEAVIKDPHIEYKETEEESTEEKDYEVIYDSVLETAKVTLSGGSEITLKSPKAKAMLMMQSWYENASEEYKSDAFASLKLAHLCLINSKQSFNDFIESLEIDDVERVAEALACFRKVFDKLKKQSTPI